MTDPFRSELDAAHQRIERMEADHRARVAELERENKRLRARLVEVAPSRTKTGRVFLAVGMMTLAISIAGGMFFARVVARPTTPSAMMLDTSTVLELDPSSSTQVGGDFNREAVTHALETVNVGDCVDASHRPGSGHVMLVLAPSGFVVSAKVDRGDYRVTSEGRCIETRFRAARVPPWEGHQSRVVGKSFDVH